MQSTNQPAKFLVPFAQNDSARVEVPATTTDATRFSQSLGSPPLTGLPPEAGGVPPQLEDFNGALNQIARGVWWALGGGRFGYDAAWATDPLIGGYARGAVLPASLGGGSAGMGEWYNNTDNNTANPDTDGTGWVPGYHYGATALTGQTGGTITLTPAQAAKTVITVSGALTSNLVLVVPPWVYRWTIYNTTTGSFTVSVRNPTSSAVTIPQDGTPTDVRGDGTNVTRTTVTVPNASTTVAGIARLATVAETAAAADGTIAVTPAGLAQTKAISWVAGLQTALDSKAATTTTITAGAGLTGGGSLAGNVTLALGASGVTAGSYGGTAGSLSVSVDGSGRIVSASNATLSVAGGGTGATTAAAARANLGLGNVDNTSDLAKPISTATQTALDGKASLAGANYFTGPNPIIMSNGTQVNQFHGGGRAGWHDVGANKDIWFYTFATNWVTVNSNMTVVGSLYANGGFQPASSRELKTAFRPNPYGLSAVLKLETTLGKYREWFNSDGRERVFLIAENIAEVMPQVAAVDGVEATPPGETEPRKYKGYAIEQMLAVYAKAFQDLHAIVQAQGERIADLEQNT